MNTRTDPRAGHPASLSSLINVPRLITAYYTERPDISVPSQRVAFGTSGHRGCALYCSFNEAHILAISQAVCLYRQHAGITGPLFVGTDTHALSEPALASALEVFAANDIETMIDAGAGFTPTPVISHAILGYNRGRTSGLADGVVISPSHNPPDDGGFKYNATNGGPADSDATGWIERTANALLQDELRDIRRLPLARARKSACVHRYDYVRGYVEDLAQVVDMEAIRASGVRIGIDPLGGAAAYYFAPIADRYGLSVTIVNEVVDPTFRFMTLDWDGRIRMDCSSPYAMAQLVGLRSEFDIAFANDTDADRHGIVCPSSGLMNPNHYLVASIAYLFGNRPGWDRASGIGKTVVSSGMIDRMAGKLGRTLVEAPVGFKWFSAGLMDRSLGFAGEESAGATLLRRDGTVWTTDKDGLALGLLAAEITAQARKDPSQLYNIATEGLGTSFYERIDAPANDEKKVRLKRLRPDDVQVRELAGEAIEAKLVNAPGNGQAIGGIKVTTKNGWFAARPSGTEAVYKIYAESFRSEEHLRQIQAEAQAIVDKLSL